jgi:signal transduction histidine kinase
MADTIVSSGESLIRILNDLIDHEKLEVGVVELFPTKIKVGEWIEKSARLYRPMAESKGLELRVDLQKPDFEAFLDTLRLQQIVSNLLSNAIKFTSAGSVEISARYHEGTELPVEIRVKDTGAGMTPEVAAGIFRLYDRGEDDRNREFGGTGVGLAVCDKLVLLMGGRIEVESAPREGSVFKVLLPAELVG